MTSPVTIRGVTFPSGRAAAKHLGVAESTIAHARSNGTLETVGTGGQGYAIPVKYKGKIYPTIKSLATHLSITSGTITRYLDKYGNLDNLAYRIDTGTLRKEPVCIPITVNGVRYPSYYAAAKALGIHYQTFRSYIYRHGAENIDETLRKRLRK